MKSLEKTLMDLERTSLLEMIMTHSKIICHTCQGYRKLSRITSIGFLNNFILTWIRVK
jgi:hypothetical protein